MTYNRPEPRITLRDEFTLDDFSGSLNQAAPPDKVPPNDFLRFMNCRVCDDAKSFERRPGMVKLHTFTVPELILNGGFDSNTDGWEGQNCTLASIAEGQIEPPPPPPPPGGYDWLLVDNSDRIVDWSKAGVWYGGVKGIPTYPVGLTINTTTPSHQYYCDPTGVVDCSTKLQAAVTACPVGYAVYMPAGTYSASVFPSMKSGVVLRGAGAGLTTLRAAGNAYISISAIDSGALALCMNPTAGPDANNRSGPITSGYAKGSYTVAVSSALAANLSVGNIVLINQLNDVFVDYIGVDGPCTWAGGGGLRALGETKRIASKSGTSITFTRPLYHAYKSSLQPKLIRLAASPKTDCGVEDLTLDGNNNDMARLVLMQGCANNWVKKVEMTRQKGFGIGFGWGAIGNEENRCYVHDPAFLGASGGYGSNIGGCATDNYIVDSIVKQTTCIVTIGSSGGTANVVAYNYCRSTDYVNHWWALPLLDTHGVHTLMNLCEGNIGPNIQLDQIWGSGSHNMFFRNWLNATWNNPAVNSNQIVARIDSQNYYISFIGNAMGYSGMSGTYETDPYVENHTIKIWARGSLYGAGPDALMRSTLIRHGNYDFVTSSVNWEPAIAGHDIPSSLYLAAKPAFFGALAWPIAGPGVTDHAQTNPAKARWDAYAISGDLASLFG